MFNTIGKVLFFYYISNASELTLIDELIIDEITDPVGYLDVVLEPDVFIFRYTIYCHHILAQGTLS